MKMKYKGCLYLGITKNILFQVDFQWSYQNIEIRKNGKNQHFDKFEFGHVFGVLCTKFLISTLR